MLVLSYRVIGIARRRRDEDDVILASALGMLRSHRPVQVDQVHGARDRRMGIFRLAFGCEEAHLACTTNDTGPPRKSTGQDQETREKESVDHLSVPNVEPRRRIRYRALQVSR